MAALPVLLELNQLMSAFRVQMCVCVSNCMKGGAAATDNNDVSRIVLRTVTDEDPVSLKTVSPRLAVMRGVSGDPEV